MGYYYFGGYGGYSSVMVILFLGVIVLTIAAQTKVSSSFKKYSRIRNHRGLTGAQAARMVLNANGLSDVKIEQIRGSLTDHYDPRKKVLRLSQTVYDVPSVAAVSVACHEAGHAIQHAKAYMPLVIRNTIVPVVNIASRLSWILIIAGIVMTAAGNYMGNTMFDIGVIAFAAIVAFHAVTLPVEFDASRRAVEQMELQGVIDYEEKSGAKKVLTAAAMTYVASLAVAVVNLLRILVIRGRND